MTEPCRGTFVLIRERRMSLSETRALSQGGIVQSFSWHWIEISGPSNVGDETIASQSRDTTPVVAAAFQTMEVSSKQNSVQSCKAKRCDFILQLLESIASCRALASN